jgi:alkylation response protein AidB-like acyl-CoA dehydrogenase
MDLELSDDQLSLQDSVRSFLEAECPVSLVRSVVEEGKGADELWQKMVDLDWPAMAVDEADGGIGLGFVELAVVAEQVGKALSPAPFLSTAAQFVPAVRIAGSSEQRHRFLEPVASRGLTGTLAIAEAAGEFGVCAIEAQATEEADGWSLRGTKHFVLDGSGADEIVVAARKPGTSGRDGVGLFVVPQESVRSAPMANLDPTRQYCTIDLDGAHVGRDRVLGSVGEASRTLATILEEATVALSAELVGTSQAMFDIVHSYVQSREQFGVKIGSFQAIKHKLADMYVALESARAITYFAALCIAEGDERRSLATSMAKSSACDCQKLVAQQSIQCLGGIGYTWEHDIHLYVKRAKASAALFGTAVEHRARVAEHIGLGTQPARVPHQDQKENAIRGHEADGHEADGHEAERSESLAHEPARSEPERIAQ